MTLFNTANAIKLGALAANKIMMGIQQVWPTLTAWLPTAWFASGEQGIWLDPSDFERYMGAKSVELSEDLGFDDPTKWYKGTGWSVSGGEAVHNGAAADYLLSLLAPIPGKMYEYTIVVEQIPAGGNITIYLSGKVVGTAITTPGTYTFAARCWNTVGLFKHGFRASNATGLTSRVSSFSIKEITNYDTVTMFQDSHGETPVTAVEQPVGFIVDKRQGLELGPELMSDVGFDNGTEWIKDAGWSVSGGKAVHFDAAASYLRTSFQPVVGQWYRYRVVTGAMSAGTFVVAYAGNSGDTFMMTLANSTYDFYLRGTGTVLGFALYSGSGAGTGKTVEVLSQSVKAVSGNHAFQATAAARPVLSARKNWLLATAAMATQSVTLAASAYTLSFKGTGTVTLTGASTAGPLVGTGVSNRVSLTFTPTTGSVTFTVSGSVTDAQLEGGSAVTTYQRVNTATNYDTVGFPHYLKFDGVDDSLATAAIDFSGTDKVTEVLGITFLNSTFGVIYELSPTIASNAGTFGRFAGVMSSKHYPANCRGSEALVDYAGMASSSQPDTCVLSATFDIAGDLTRTRRNGVYGIDETTDKGSGNFTSQPLFIGRRNGASSPAAFQLNQLILRGAATTGLTDGEAFANTKTGAY